VFPSAPYYLQSAEQPPLILWQHPFGPPRGQEPPQIPPNAATGPGNTIGDNRRGMTPKTTTRRSTACGRAPRPAKPTRRPRRDRRPRPGRHRCCPADLRCHRRGRSSESSQHPEVDSTHRTSQIRVGHRSSLGGHYPRASPWPSPSFPGGVSDKLGREGSHWRSHGVVPRVVPLPVRRRDFGTGEQRGQGDRVPVWCPIFRPWGVFSGRCSFMG
jgi:hypothetical protein